LQVPVSYREANHVLKNHDAHWRRDKRGRTVLSKEKSIGRGSDVDASRTPEEQRWQITRKTSSQVQKYRQSQNGEFHHASCKSCQANQEGYVPSRMPRNTSDEIDLSDVFRTLYPPYPTPSLYQKEESHFLMNTKRCILPEMSPEIGFCVGTIIPSLCVTCDNCLIYVGNTANKASEVSVISSPSCR
jgi:hypothetical protein